MKPFVKVCESKVLRRGIVVCCGPKTAVKALFLDPRTFEGFDFSKRFLAERWRVVERAWDAACGDSGEASGFTVKDGGDVYVVLPKWDSRVFVHEAYHAAQAVLRITGDARRGARGVPRGVAVRGDMLGPVKPKQGEKTMTTGICPYARGFDPHDLTCDLAVAEDEGLPWWRRVIRALAGRYDCPHFNGDLPCERYDSSNKEGE